MVSAEKPQCHTHFVRVTMCFPSRQGRWNIRPGIGKTVKSRVSYSMESSRRLAAFYLRKT